VSVNPVMLYNMDILVYHMEFKDLSCWTPDHQLIRGKPHDTVYGNGRYGGMHFL